MILILCLVGRVEFVFGLEDDQVNYEKPINIEVIAVDEYIVQLQCNSHMETVHIV